MSLSSEPSSRTTSGRFTSPDLRLRSSVAMWGPLQLTLVNHREGVELGYRAGEDAYLQYGQDLGTLAEEVLSTYMTIYLAAPSYRPRALTTTILAEWKAMFVLGWTGRMLESSPLLHVDASSSSSRGEQGIREAASNSNARPVQIREREQR